MRRAWIGALLSLWVITLTGCGTVINGMHQDLAITSHPGGATVTVDGEEQGVTPAVVPVWRKHAHVVKIEQPGYRPVEASIVPRISEWAWGNIIFAGLIGLAVDAWSGGLYELSQDRVTATFPNRVEKPADTQPATALSAR